MRSLVWLLVVVLVSSTVAEQGVLILMVTDTLQHPFDDVRIGLAGGGGSPQFTKDGRARLTLADKTVPGDWVTLQIFGAPKGMDLVFVSPYDSRVRVPPFEREQDNYAPVVVARRGDLSILQRGSGMLAIHVTINRSAGKKSRHPISYNSDHFNGGTLKRVASYADLSTLKEAPIGVAAEKFGIPISEIKAAIDDWGGGPTVWKIIALTAAIETGGTDPFTFVYALPRDVWFGIGTWSLQECSLQPVLLSFQEKNPDLFKQILGDGASLLTKAASAPCKPSHLPTQSSNSEVNDFIEAAIERPRMLRPVWKQRMTALGRDPQFQHVQVVAMMRWVDMAKSTADLFGLTSEQGLAFCYGTIRSVGAARIRLRHDAFLKDVTAFEKQLGRPPDQQEQLLILANRVIESDKRGGAFHNQQFINEVTLLSRGSGVAYGHMYSLADYDIGFTDVTTGADIPLRNDSAILQRLESGWMPSGSGSAAD
jgi:hypothetical protein